MLPIAAKAIQHILQGLFGDQCVNHNLYLYSYLNTITKWWWMKFFMHGQCLTACARMKQNQYKL